jgi:hypothetical protein
MRGRLREILEWMLSSTLTGLMERHSWKQGLHAVTKRETLHVDDSTRSPHLCVRITASGDNESNFEARLAKLLAGARFFCSACTVLLKQQQPYAKVCPVRIPVRSAERIETS